MKFIVLFAVIVQGLNCLLSAEGRNTYNDMEISDDQYDDYDYTNDDYDDDYDDDDDDDDDGGVIRTIQEYEGVEKMKRSLQETKPNTVAKKKKAGKRSKTRKITKKKGKKRIKKRKQQRNRQVSATEPPVEERTSGPFGYLYPEDVDWTVREYRCGNCEDTLIIYDPWYAPPPTIYLPIFCTSNLSLYNSWAEKYLSYGPNLTFIFIPGSLNCTNQLAAKQVNFKQFSVELSQNTSDDAGEKQTFFNCGAEIEQDETDYNCGEEAPEYSVFPTNHSCFWHIYAYEHWRRQIVFKDWDLPSCPDGSTKGDCCKQGPHLLISQTGYAKKLEAYCGQTAPKFENTVFDLGRARWLIIFNNTLHKDQIGKSNSKLAFQARSIGYRRTASYDQKFYGKKCLCGLRNTNRPVKDPLEKSGIGRREANPSFSHNKTIRPNRKIKNETLKLGKRKQIKKKTPQKYAKVNKDQRNPKRKNGKKGKSSRKKKKVNSKSKNEKVKKTGKMSVKQDTAASKGPNSPFKSIWPWLVSVVYDESYVCTGYAVSPSIVVIVTKCFHWITDIKGTDQTGVEDLNSRISKIYVICQDEQDIGVESGYWEEKRTVKQIRIHPSCDPVVRPQYCVLALILSDGFNMTAPYRPRPSCLTCKLNSMLDKMTRATPLLAGYGLRKCSVMSVLKDQIKALPRPIVSVVLDRRSSVIPLGLQLEGKVF
ncbi:uncharacterized protein LOC111703668 isoform X2 [Eurytemora carolleeae]|uniref:uncharacterized protein LOC111703668 isoform X2 n=1 Tax=Eurytemora carolleeae TaxID=1294199 RepID=UPI000C76D441|nr:uncharacterized protein LOC111703668 isoform X2 [Eurytemora carolleeae]|eukprot:XP_023331455.1 uncharacterized protein LOC111703668 isoform X2 [Eurytemora affinis]